LTGQFVAIETSSYESRADFCDRLEELLSIVAKTLRPPIYDRLGIRYINRIEDASVIADLPMLVQPAAMAGLAVPRDGVDIVHSLCDSLFAEGRARLQIRWGWLPAGAGIDTTVSPPSVPYWLLDIDVFSQSGGPFDVGELGTLARDFAERAHRFFRWTVRDEFLRRFGGKP
jgi:uncharacterized protein (TIGR04255 family)